MDTVSYLTINDETKEIADIASRNDIENMAAIIAAHTDDIEYIQLETGPEGSFSTSISETQAMAQSAQVNAAAASEAAAIADEKAVSAGESAARAWTYADSASEAAATAWDRAGQALDSAATAEAAAASATNAANSALDQANSATAAAATAWNKADEASDAADLANHKADLAGAAAEAAQHDADRANNYANGALTGLSTLESVVDTVNWFAEHKSLSTDTEVNSDKNYYTYDSSTGTMSKIEPSGLENPSEEGWYEIDETVQNYVASHIAQTDDGLYVLSTTSGWRVLVSTGSGDYIPGIFIVDPYGVIKQSMTGDGISFDDTSPFSIGDDDAYIVFDGNGHITLGGAGVSILSSVSIGGSTKTLSEVLNDLGQAITVIEYGVGNSPDDHRDILEWSNESPQWEPGKYVWMRTSNGTNYRYTCIQGAQGPAGETGARGESGEAGAEGVGVQSVEISYATSENNYIMPEDDAWSDEIDTENPPEQGTWLWIRTVTTYSDDTSSATYQQSYIGTDGADGKSVFIQSVSKSNGVTTVILVDSDGNTETLTINDGEDGDSGVPGTDGKSIHIAWADDIVINQDSSVTATGFSTSVSTNKKYMGVYSNMEITDSTNPSDYNWSLIKGNDAYNNARILLYRRAATQPSPPSSSLTYTFASGTLTGSLSNWSVDIPAGDQPCWVTAATATSTGTTDTITANEWTTPVKVFEDGAAGLNQATITLYQRAATQPTKPSGEITYSFINGTLTGTLGNWTKAMPTSDGNPCWVTTAVAISSETTDTILANEWSTPIRLVSDGTKGDTGDSAYSYDLLCSPSAIVKTSATATPAAITFTSKRGQGTKNPENYAGRFIIATSEDGSTWTNQYTSSSNEATKEYTPLATAKFVRCQLYLAGGTTTLVDTQTIPIISDGEKGATGQDGKVLNISSGVFKESQLPSVETVDEGDAYLVDDEDGQYDLYYKGSGGTTWTIIENWQGAVGPAGATGDTGPQGAAGTPGADGYTIILTNESHIFPAGVSAALASTTTCNILAYKGTTQIGATIGNITGQVTGLTTNIPQSSNGTTLANFTVSAATTLTTKSGTLTIPIVVDGKSFEKKFTWALANEGAIGATGPTGQTGQAGPEAVVTIIPSDIDWDDNGGKGSAKLTAILRVNGVEVNPLGYNWTKGANTTSLGITNPLIVDDLNSTYNCTVTW